MKIILIICVMTMIIAQETSILNKPKIDPPSNFKYNNIAQEQSEDENYELDENEEDQLWSEDLLGIEDFQNNNHLDPQIVPLFDKQQQMNQYEDLQIQNELNNQIQASQGALNQQNQEQQIDQAANEQDQFDGEQHQEQMQQSGQFQENANDQPQETMPYINQRSCSADNNDPGCQHPAPEIIVIETPFSEIPIHVQEIPQPIGAIPIIVQEIPLPIPEIEQIIESNSGTMQIPLPTEGRLKPSSQRRKPSNKSKFNNPKVDDLSTTNISQDELIHQNNLNEQPLITDNQITDNGITDPGIIIESGFSEDRIKSAEYFKNAEAKDQSFTDAGVSDNTNVLGYQLYLDNNLQIPYANSYPGLKSFEVELNKFRRQYLHDLDIILFGALGYVIFAIFYFLLSQCFGGTSVSAPFGYKLVKLGSSQLLQKGLHQQNTNGQAMIKENTFITPTPPNSLQTQQSQPQKQFISEQQPSKIQAQPSKTQALQQIPSDLAQLVYRQQETISHLQNQMNKMQQSQETIEKALLDTQNLLFGLMKKNDKMSKTKDQKSDAASNKSQRTSRSDQNDNDNQIQLQKRDQQYSFSELDLDKPLVEAPSRPKKQDVEKLKPVIEELKEDSVSPHIQAQIGQNLTPLAAPRGHQPKLPQFQSQIQPSVSIPQQKQQVDQQNLSQSQVAPNLQEKQNDQVHVIKEIFQASIPQLDKEPPQLVTKQSSQRQNEVQLEPQFNPVVQPQVTQVQSLPKPVITGLPKRTLPIQRLPQRQVQNPFEQK